MLDQELVKEIQKGPIGEQLIFNTQNNPNKKQILIPRTPLLIVTDPNHSANYMPIEETEKTYKITKRRLGLIGGKEIYLPKNLGNPTLKQTALDLLQKSIKPVLAMGMAATIFLSPLTTHFKVSAKDQMTKQEAIEYLSTKTDSKWYPSFKDLPQYPNKVPAQEEAEALKLSGVVKGYPDGTVKLDQNVTRAEFATLLCKTFNIDTENYKDYNIPFKDVSKNDWFYQFVAAAYKEGLIKGYPDGTFKPKRNVTKAEAITMIVNAGKKYRGWDIVEIGNDFKDVNPTDWFYKFVETATQMGIIPKDDLYIVEQTQDGLLFRPNNPSKRGQNIIFLYRGAPQSTKDIDNDGLDYINERRLGTNPNNPDTDGDGLIDGKDKNPTIGIVFINPGFKGDKQGNYKNYQIFALEDLDNYFSPYEGNIDTEILKIHTLDELIKIDHRKDRPILRHNPTATFYHLYYNTNFYTNLMNDVDNYITKNYPTGAIPLDDVYEYFGNKIFEEYKKLNPDKPFFGYFCGEKYFNISLILRHIFEKFDGRTFEIKDFKNGKYYKYKANHLYVTDVGSSITRANYSADGNFSHEKYMRHNHILPLIISEDRFFYTTNLGPTSKIYAISTGPFFETRNSYTDFQKYIFNEHLNLMDIQTDIIEKYREDLFKDVRTPHLGILTFSTFGVDDDPLYKDVRVYSDWSSYRKISEFILNNKVKETVPFFRVMSSADRLKGGKYLMLYSDKENRYFLVRVSETLWNKFKNQYKINPISPEVSEALKIIYSQ